MENVIKTINTLLFKKTVRDMKKNFEAKLYVSRRYINLLQTIFPPDTSCFNRKERYQKWNIPFCTKFIRDTKKMFLLPPFHPKWNTELKIYEIESNELRWVCLVINVHNYLIFNEDEITGTEMSVRWDFFGNPWL